MLGAAEKVATEGHSTWCGYNSMPLHTSSNVLVPAPVRCCRCVRNMMAFAVYMGVLLLLGQSRGFALALGLFFPRSAAAVCLLCLSLVFGDAFNLPKGHCSQRLLTSQC